MQSVPIIDLRPCLPHNDTSTASNNSSVETLQQQLSRACREWGFFYLTVSGGGDNMAPLIDPELREAFQNIMRNFFLRVTDPKVQDACRRTSDNAWGYFDVEFTKNKRDWKRGFDCGFQEVSEIDGVNRWPQEDEQKDIQGFQATLKAYMQRMAELSEQLLELVLQSLNANRGDDDDVLLDVDRVRQELQLGQGTHSSFLRLNYYPICNVENEKQFGIRRHTDAGLITLLWQDDVISGLQVFSGGVEELNTDREELENDPRWVDVPPVEGTIVVNIGDMLQVITNGKCKAALHRVKANSSVERFSAPFFYNPPYEANCSPMVVMSDEDKNKKKVAFKPINWGEFRRRRFEGDYADVGHEIQITDFTTK